MENVQQASSYDDLPYDSYSFPQSHPDRLATLARLFGLNPADLTISRVLELGCAKGNNLIPLACTYPNAEFVGVDLSSRHISEGQSLIDKLELQNIELKHLDIAQISKELGQFDYVIAHGVYSWVDAGIREKILEVCSENLAPQGVAYVSYNTLPGWHQKNVIRDMMMFHTSHFAKYDDKAAQARALLDFVSQAVPAEQSYGSMLKSELEFLMQQPNSYLLHDYLEDENKPIYFYQFIEHAATHNLQYLSDVDFTLMLTTNLAPPVGDTLRRLSNDLVRTEQYMDFIRNRAFRQTLLCHKEVQINRNLDWKNVRPFRFASPALCSASREELLSDQPVDFSLRNGTKISIRFAPVKVAFHKLTSIWPRSASFEELVSSISELSETVINDANTNKMHEQLLGSDLLTAYTAGIVTFRLQEDAFVTQISDHPRASKLAQDQAGSGRKVTNQLHDSVDADIFVRSVIKLLDGSLDIEGIISAQEGLISDESLVVYRDGRKLMPGPELRQTLRQLTQEALSKLASSAMLVP